MKKVLVTGAAGFIGSHLCEYLTELGKEVTAFVHYNSKTSWGWLETSPIKNEIQVIAGDLRDFDSVDKAIRGNEGVYHLGALIGIPYSYESPLAYIRTNVEGTYNVLESAKRRNLEKIVVTSTSEVYGTGIYVPIDEKHPLQPQSPYSASKIGADNLALSYHRSFQTPVVVARPFNTFGPRQSARAIVPTIAVQLLNKQPMIKLGNLSPTRDLTYVRDTVSGIVTISEEPAFLGKAVNIGTGTAVSIGDLLAKLSQITQHFPKVTEDIQRVRPESSEVARLLSDNQLLRTTTPWKPEYTIEKGLELTVNWLKENLSHYKPEHYAV